MRLLKVTAVIIALALVAIQFIRPHRNNKSGAQPKSITQMIPVPAQVHALLKNACYDCHSNNTQYPWYVNIQPVAWVMAHHVTEGKAVLNFDEFGTYSKRRQASKLKSIANSLQDGSMPIASYTWMHAKARLDDSSRSSIISWALYQKDSLEARY